MNEPTRSASSPTTDELTARVEADATDVEPAWLLWLQAILPSVCTAPFASHHVRLWEWVWAIVPGVRPGAFVAVWARGGAKSSSAEAACVMLGARRRRRYGWYVSGTQDLADDHVGSVGSVLESAPVGLWYPELASRAVGKYGNSKGWRRNRLHTAAGFTVDALGLDTAVRGVKIDEQRPDFLVIDDVDQHDDSPRETQAKIDTLTRAILPAGAADLAVLAIQNLVHPTSVFAKLVSDDAGFLTRREVSGPIPAVDGLVVERQHDDQGRPRDVLVAGVPTWAGQSLEVCQAQIDDWGLRAFVAEAQHDVQRVEGALWDAAQIHAGRRERAPDLSLVVVGVDPSGGDGPRNDEQGIVTVGKGTDGHAYVLGDVSGKRSPGGWGRAAVQAFIDHRADRIVGEANFGGAMVKSTIESAAQEMHREGLLGSPLVPVSVRTASRGKRVRAEPVAALYGEVERPESWPDARVHHVGVFGELEVEMTRWTPDSRWSPNRLDALVWAVHELGVARVSGGGSSASAQLAMIGRR